jgi:hypothetical protein
VQSSHSSLVAHTWPCAFHLARLCHRHDEVVYLLQGDKRGQIYESACMVESTALAPLERRFRKRLRAFVVTLAERLVGCVFVSLGGGCGGGVADGARGR